MTRHWLSLCAALHVIAFMACGCGRTDDPDREPQLPAWLTEDDSETESEDITLATGEASYAPDAPQAELRLSLQPGDRIPLRKVIEQELQQASLDGVPQISRSHLELVLTIAVEDIQSSHQRLRVQYDRVRYSHDIAGEHVEYDSAAPPAAIPPAALAYHSMVNDGFSFVLGPDHQVAEVIGFREFLERCLQHVPVEQRQRVMLDIEASSGEKGISDFVDSTIGLLPAEINKSLGESWEKSRQIGRPVPMHINTVYTLRGLNDRLADIGVSGTILPSTTLGQSAEDEPSFKIVVQGGRSEGRCTLYRDSGLPKESHVERVVEMSVQLAGGIEFNQQNRTLTTVESFPIQSATPASDPPAAASAPTRFQ